MNTDSVEYKFGILMGAVKDNSDWSFNKFIDRCNYYIDDFDITKQMLWMIMEQYCSDCEFVRNTDIIKVGAGRSIIGAVYFDKEECKIKHTELCEGSEDSFSDDEEDSRFGYCNCGERKLCVDICGHGIADGICCLCMECRLELGQDDFTERICDYCDKNFDLSDPHYYDEEQAVCYCSEECYKKFNSDEDK